MQFKTSVQNNWEKNNNPQTDKPLDKLIGEAPFQSRPWVQETFPSAPALTQAGAGEGMGGGGTPSLGHLGGQREADWFAHHWLQGGKLPAPIAIPP